MLLSTIWDYFKGFIEITNSQTPRYCFIIDKLDIVYQGTLIKTKVNYTPVGCYRPFGNFTSELNDEMTCRKFKPDHARIIIGIDTLEKTLDFNNQEQMQIYLGFVKLCMNRLKAIHE